MEGASTNVCMIPDDAMARTGSCDVDDDMEGVFLLTIFDLSEFKGEDESGERKKDSIGVGGLKESNEGYLKSLCEEK